MRIKKSGLFYKILRNKLNIHCECGCGCEFKFKLRHLTGMRQEHIINGCGFTGEMTNAYALLTNCPECGEEVTVCGIPEDAMQKIKSAVGQN